MSLDPCPSAAELLRMKAEREGRGRQPVLDLVSFTPNPALYDAPQPIALRIPWSCLISDNALYVTVEGKRYKTKEYKEAQKRIKEYAADVMGGRPLLDCPLRFSTRFYVPNTHRRDVQNFIAGLADSLKGVVFTDDHWLHAGDWQLVGRDIDAPRCELTIAPLTPTEHNP